MKAQNARGTRDFSPAEVKKRSYIIDTIKKQYELYGYLPIETPAIEKLSTLTGKYGEEGDQLLFKILNSRLHESKNKEVLREEFNKMLEKPYHSEYITERALRYDLTVPFARYVSQYRHQITFPFKRYQIQPVWRADKPQKGRYREFVQCDADAIGTNSLLMEIELIQLIQNVFVDLKLPVILKINNRKILSGIIDYIGANDKFVEIVTLIDKLDKAEADVIKDEMQMIGLSEHQIEKIFDILSLKKDNFEILERLRSIDNSILQKGIDEIYYVLNFYRQNLSGIEQKNFELKLDITLARGLNYYTGIIFEAKANAGNFQPSILGGGRYDDLTGIFDLPNVSGVGISFGIDRIYDVMEEAGLFPSYLNNISPAKILLIYMEETYLPYVFEIAHQLRQSDISVEIYHQKDKLKKCFDYAHKKSFPYVGIVGESEASQRMVALKNMQSGEQQTLSLQQIIQTLNT
ncbi:MAG: histidine--tRNA ligase [Bacteroidia bacterium]